MNHIYWWITCTDCQHRQYIGADLENTEQFISGYLKEHAGGVQHDKAELGLHGLGSSLSIALKFIHLHNGHSLTLAYTTTEEDNYSEYLEEWPIENGTLITPSWDTITPLGLTEGQARKDREIARLKLSMEQLQTAYFNMRLQVDAKTDGERIRIAREFRQWVEEHGGVLYGPAAADTDEAVLPVLPPISEQKAAAIVISQGLQPKEEEI